MHFAQLCLQIKWVHHRPYCKNTGEIKENPYAKNVLRAICTARAAGLESACLRNRDLQARQTPLDLLTTAFCSAFLSAQNAFPAGHCTTVPLTANIPAQWLWLISQLGSVSCRRECFSLFSALLFCSWLEQAAASGVNLGPLPIAVSDVNTFLNVWLLALFPNRSQKNLSCTTLWFV